MISWRAKMIRVLASVLAIALLMLESQAPAHAQAVLTDSPSEPAVWGPTAGALTALIPLGVGGVLLANDRRPALQHAGIYVVTAGFALAPWVSHLSIRRWQRAVVFGLVSLALSAGTVTAMAITDPFDPEVGNRRRLAFGTLFTTAFFSSAVGIVDGYLVGPPARGTP